MACSDNYEFQARFAVTNTKNDIFSDQKQMSVRRIYITSQAATKLEKI